MNRTIFLIITIAIFTALVGFVSYRTTYALFSDTATSTNNVFSAAAEFPTPTPPIAQTLVMNEILPVSSCNSGQTNGQFVELWNGSGADVNLKDYSLSDGTVTLAIANSNTILANGSFAILVKAEGVINQCLGGNVNDATTVNLGGNINLNTGLLRLIGTDGVTVIDRVEFGSSNSGVLQTQPDQSIERNLLGLDSATGDTFNVSDFSKQCPVTPGTWSTPTGTCPVVINEIMWMGSTNNTSDEWMELRNTSGNSINLAGWTIEGAGTGGGEIFTITSGTVSANGLFLISHFSATDSAISVTPDLVSTSLQLDNTDQQYILKNNLGHIVDVADDGIDAPSAGSNGTPKASMERNSTPGNGALSTSWHTATTTVNFDGGILDKGTPKAAND